MFKGEKLRQEGQGMRSSQKATRVRMGPQRFDEQIGEERQYGKVCELI